MYHCITLSIQQVCLLGFSKFTELHLKTTPEIRPKIIYIFFLTVFSSTVAQKTRSPQRAHISDEWISFTIEASLNLCNTFVCIHEKMLVYIIDTLSTLIHKKIYKIKFLINCYKTRSWKLKYISTIWHKTVTPTHCFTSTKNVYTQRMET